VVIRSKGSYFPLILLYDIEDVDNASSLSNLLENNQENPMNTNKKLWLDLGVPGSLFLNVICQQDHAVGLLMTILKNAGVNISLASTRNIFSRYQLTKTNLKVWTCC